MTKRSKHILFEKVGMAYMPANGTGWFLLFVYLAFAVPLVIAPEIIFPHSGFVSAYQVGAFLLFWWAGLRFAKRHSA